MAGLLVLQGPPSLHRPGGDGSDKVRDPIHFRRETNYRTRPAPVQTDAIRLNARSLSQQMESIQHKV